MRRDNNFWGQQWTMVLEFMKCTVAHNLFRSAATAWDSFLVCRQLYEATHLKMFSVGQSLSGAQVNDLPEKAAHHQQSVPRSVAAIIASNFEDPVRNKRTISKCSIVEEIIQMLLLLSS